MSQLSIMIENLKNKVQQVEQAIVQSIANHNALLGQGQALKHMLDVAVGLAEDVVPSNPVVEGLEVVDKIVDEVSDNVTNIVPTDEPTV